MRRVISLLFLFFCFGFFVYAATVGVIDTTDKYAKVLAGPYAGTQIDFRPNDTATVQGIEVHSDRIRGYAWGEATGYIVFSCEDTVSGCSSSNGNFKVTNDGSGNLAGFAWGANTGWISFSCSNSTSSCSGGAGAWGVEINTTTGEFEGHAWSQNFGYIQFDCNTAGACLKTDWAPGSGTTTTGGGGGGSSSTTGTTTGTTTSTDPDPDPDPDPDYDCSRIFYELYGRCPDGTTTGTTTTGQTTGQNTGQTTTGQTTTGNTTTGQTTTGQATTGQTTAGNTTTGQTTGTNTGQGVTGGSGSGTNGGTVFGGTTGFVSGGFGTGSNGTGSSSSSGGTGSGSTGPGSFGPVGTTLTNTVRDILKTSNTQEFIDGVAEAVSQAIPIGGILAGMIAALAALFFVNAVSFSELLFLPARIWSSLLLFFGIAKKPWGVVYDSLTKQPIDPAYVTLIDVATNEEVSSSLTDINGRYGFDNVKKGKYRIEASKTHYKFPSNYLLGHESDDIYEDLYFGQEFEVLEDGALITKNIPIDAESVDWNEVAKREQNLMSFNPIKESRWQKIAHFIFIAGFIASILFMISLPVLGNKISLIFYIVAGILMYVLRIPKVRAMLSRSHAIVLESASDAPLPFAMVEIKNPETGVVVTKRVTNQDGMFYALLEKGSYKVAISKPEKVGSYTKVFESDPLSVKKGFISSRFEV